MSLEDLPTTAFINPYGENYEQIQLLTQQVTNLLFQHLAKAANEPPLPENFKLLEPLGLPEK